MGTAIEFFSKILMIVLSGILLHGIVQNFLFNIVYALKCNIDIVCEGTAW